MRPLRLLAAVAVAVLLLPLSKADESKDTRIVETILRLEGFDLSGSEKAQAAVSRYLEANLGKGRYFDDP